MADLSSIERRKLERLLRNRLDMLQGRTETDDQRLDGLHFPVQRRQIELRLPAMVGGHADGRQ